MNTKFATDQYQSVSSKIVIALRYFIVIYIVSVILFLVYAWAVNDMFWLFMLFTAIVPFGLLLTLIYRLSQRRIVRAKTLRLADVLEDASRHLEHIPRKIMKYDTDLSIRTAFVWRDVFSPFTLAIARLLQQAKFMIISEDVGRDRTWSIDTSLNCPPAILARQTELIARAMRENDIVAAFEAMGELLSLPITKIARVHRSGPEFTSEEFVQACKDIARLLAQREFLDADYAIQALIVTMRQRPHGDAPMMKWQSLIVYWLTVRVSAMKASVPLGSPKLWVGPSKILAAQLNAAVNAYQQQDYAELSEIIYESFDWRSRVPRIVL